MTRRTRLLLATLPLAGALALGTVGWSGAAPDAGGVPAKAETRKSHSGPPAVAKRAKLRLIDSRYGRMLADGDRYALYLFTRDAGPDSECSGKCAKAWPPFKTRRKPRAKGSLDDELLGTIRRGGGRKQVTYAGHPLYYYVDDTDPGDVLCQDVEEFGGHWYVVDRDGDPIL